MMPFHQRKKERVRHANRASLVKQSRHRSLTAISASFSIGLREAYVKFVNGTYLLINLGSAIS